MKKAVITLALILVAVAAFAAPNDPCAPAHVRVKHHRAAPAAQAAPAAPAAVCVAGCPPSEVNVDVTVEQPAVPNAVAVPAAGFWSEPLGTMLIAISIFLALLAAALLGGLLLERLRQPPPAPAPAPVPATAPAAVQVTVAGNPPVTSVQNDDTTVTVHGHEPVTVRTDTRGGTTVDVG